jgi:hypothetical protein
MAAVPLAFGSLILFFGGIGPLMWFGHFADHSGHGTSSPSVAIAVIAYGYVLVLWLGLGISVVRWSGLARAYRTSVERAWHWADYVLLFGHIALILSGVHWVIGRIAGYDLFYALLMVAALAYSVGLGALALTFRRGETAPKKEPNAL